MPQVSHGNFTCCQTAAVEKYLAALSDRFKVLSPQQVAVDNMFAAYCEELRVGCYKVSFGDAAAKSGAKDTLPPVLDKYLTALEKLVPESGFINGQEFPTTADLILVNFSEASGPFTESFALAGGYNWQDKFPKIKANVDRSLATTEVEAYIKGSRSLKATVGPKLYAGVFAKEIGHLFTLNKLRTSATPEAPPNGPARPASSIAESEAVQLIYFPMAGRGELSRLIAAAGGVQLQEQPPPEDGSHKEKFTGSLPQLAHGSFEMTQTGAIESYLAAIAPKFQGLTIQQRAIDDCYAATKEDLIQGLGPAVFGEGEEKVAATDKVPGILDKFLSVLEEKTPEQGFTHGLDFPTGADLALLNITGAEVPFQAAMQAAGYDWQSKCPKIKALVERVQEAPGVKEYLASTTSFGASLS